MPACRHLLQTAAKVLKPYQAHLQCPTGFEPKAQISQIWAAISKFAFSINLHQCSSGPCKFPHCRLQDNFFSFKATEKKTSKNQINKKRGGGRASFLFSKVCHSKLGHTPIFFFAAAPQSNCKWTLPFFSLRLRRRGTHKSIVSSVKWTLPFFSLRLRRRETHKNIVNNVSEHYQVPFFSLRLRRRETHKSIVNKIM